MFSKLGVLLEVNLIRSRDALSVDNDSDIREHSLTPIISPMSNYGRADDSLPRQLLILFSGKLESDHLSRSFYCALTIIPTAGKLISAPTTPPQSLFLISARKVNTCNFSLKAHFCTHSV